MYSLIEQNHCNPLRKDEKEHVLLCKQTHGTTVHNKLTECPSWDPEFKKVWVSSWGIWATQMEAWYNQATSDDKHRMSKLQIPESIIEGLHPSQNRTYSDKWRCTNILSCWGDIAAQYLADATNRSWVD